MPITPLLARLTLQPIADASVLVLLIVSLALHFLLSGLGLLFFGPKGSRTRPLVHGTWTLAQGYSINGQVLLMVASAIVLSGLFFLLFERTVAGKALRATAVNRVGARLVGIRPARTALLAYTGASLLAGMIGVLIAPVTTMYYDSGFIIGLKAFIAAIIGGLVSYPLTALGAIAVGVFESFASFWSGELKDVLVFSLLIPVLLLRSFLAKHIDEDKDSGRAIRSLRGGATLLASVGADAYRVRLSLFITAALLAGLAGWLYAHLNRFVSPSPFDLRASIEYLLMAVAGGLGQIAGATVGSALVLLLKNSLQDWLPLLTQRGAVLEAVAFSIIFILLLHHARAGLMGFVTRQTRGLFGAPPEGKTTLLAAAMGLLPSTGTLRFEGENLHGRDVEGRVERGLCLVPEKRELFGDLSVLDNLQLGAYAKRLRGDTLKCLDQCLLTLLHRAGTRAA